MEAWNKLLKRQVWKHFGKKPIPQELTSIFQSVSNSYDHFERENAHLSRIMDLSSEELFAANVELRKRNDELDRFVYSTSHDLRAPLTSILGLLHLIEITEDEPSTKEYLELIKTSAIKLDDFIGDIVMYTRNKKTELINEPIDFDKLILNCSEKLDYMPNASLLEKKVHIQSTIEFYSDPHRMDNILSNLISNSIKYFNPSITDPFYQIDILVDEKKAYISIADNGIGIEEIHTSKVFDMFYRASYQSKGSGIGLYIVKEIVEKLSGSITVSSKLGSGTTFKIELPNNRLS